MKKDISTIATYHSGVMQASAHRILTRSVSDFLLQYGLTSMQWYIIGHVYDAGSNGLRITDLMRKVHTTLPYVTNSIALLESKEIVRKIPHAGDSRIKLVSITPQYRPQVEGIEEGMRDHMRAMLYKSDGITREELQDYLTVVYKIVKNNTVP